MVKQLEAFQNRHNVVVFRAEEEEDRRTPKKFLRDVARFKLVEARRRHPTESDQTALDLALLDIDKSLRQQYCVGLNEELVVNSAETATGGPPIHPLQILTLTSPSS